ncbi:MAG: hypothetical protein IK111_02800 [Lachnospiraceae bacterium]|nr:hypothetical protein [Lachnospiraceae bacterium]
MDEQQFRKNMIKLRSLAKSQGDRISKEQVKRMFLPLNMEEGHFLLIYRYLDEEKVKVFETDSELDESSNDKKASSLKMNSDDSEYLKMYIEELNLLDIPSKESRSLIIEEILNDRSRAGELMPNLYLREVVDVARLYEGQGVALEDLVGEGNVGILTGIKMLDCCDSVEEVEEFMMKMIMDSMEAVIMDKFSGDDFDIKVLERVNDLNDKAREMAEDLERLVTVEEMAKELDTDEEYIRETLRISGNSIEYIKDVKNNP